MLLSDSQLQELLISNELLTEAQLKDFLALAETQKKSLLDVVVEKDIATIGNITMLIADSLNVPFVSLNNVSIPLETLQILPEQFARKHQLVVFETTDKGIKLAAADVLNKTLLDMIGQKINGTVSVALTTPQGIEEALRLYKTALQATFETMMEQVGSDKKSSEVPVTKIVDLLIQYAFENKASDIHIEPEEKKSLIRFRIDGILHDVLIIPKEFHEQIVTRIKVLSQLRTDEHMSAQDGKLQFKLEQETIDVRVSIVPIVEGEKIVMRLLASHAQRFTLSDLGMSDSDLQKVKAAMDKPYGMILSTGPTGSGKTTTIYAMLKILNTRDKNIASIEDPVEYEVTGVNQIQVNPKTNLTFADGLRALLRQDPNIIFVGEIRDKETADIATNSALTGHVVISTLHTNDAVTSLPRLIDMDVEPFLVASTVNAIIAQRLVRKICSTCRISETVSRQELLGSVDPDLVDRIWGKEKEIVLYHGKGCSVCHQTGYQGRIGVFEILTMSEEIKKLVTNKADSQQLFKTAQSQGMRTMFEDGLSKVQQGLTTLEEVIRVTTIIEKIT